MESCTSSSKLKISHYGGLFALLGLNPFCYTMARYFEVRELGLALLGLRFRPACAQVGLTQCRCIRT